MSYALNKVQLIGNIGADPEIRKMKSGEECCSLSIATSEKWTDKETNEKKQRTEWHRVTVFDPKLVEVIKQYVRKGSHIYLQGQLQTRKWTDDKGQDRWTTEVVLQRFRGELGLLNTANGNRPPEAQSPNEYGTVTTQDMPNQDVQNPPVPEQAPEGGDNTPPF